MIQSVISENSQEMKNEEDSENFDKVEIEYTNKVSESVDKLLKDNATARQGRKIFMVGEKRMIGEVSSSSSRERGLIKFYAKNPALIKSNDNAQDKNSAKKLNKNINKEFAKKYATKVDVGKVSRRIMFCRRGLTQTQGSTSQQIKKIFLLTYWQTTQEILLTMELNLLLFWLSLTPFRTRS